MKLPTRVFATLCFSASLFLVSHSAKPARAQDDETDGELILLVDPLDLLAQQPTTQPPTTQPPTTPDSPSDRPPVRPDNTRETPRTRTRAPIRRSTSFRRSSTRLARAPDIFGDILSSGQLSAQTNFNFVTADIPLSSGARRTKIAEHNKALTDDRAFFLFHHFENAVGFTRAPGPNTPPISFTDRSIDRYTIGVERSLAEGLWSIEVRMPFTSGVNIQENSPALPAQPDFQLFSGQVGDISVALKHQLYEDDTLGIAAGLGVTAPTGSDVQGFLPFAAPAAAQFRISNDAIHLLPFIGFVTTPSERCFAHGFLQVDVPTNGNRVIATNGVGGLATGRLNESTLLYLDGSIGYWLHQDPTRRWMRGVAVSGELHYTRSLQSADSMPFFNGVFGDGDGRVEFLNGTIGLHCALTAGTSVRVAAVLPLLGGVRRSFDAEAQAAIIRQF